MKYVNVCSVILVNPKHVYIYKKTGKNTGMKQQNWIEQCKINMIKSKRKIEKIRLPFCLPKRSAKGGDKSQREERRANPTSMVLFFQLPHLNIFFFYSSSTLSLSSSSPISLLRYKASHPKLPPPHQPDLPPPLLLYLKLNHHTTTIDKIQETHTQNQSPRQKPRPNPHPNPPSPNPRNPYPKSIITTVKIHQAHGDGERENRKEKREKKKTGEERKRKERRDE